MADGTKGKGTMVQAVVDDDGAGAPIDPLTAQKKREGTITPMSQASQNGYLTIEDIAKAPDTVTEELDVPEWGGRLVIRSLTKGQQQDARRKSMREGEISTDLLEMHVFITGVVEPAMTEEHFGMLRQKSFGVVEGITRKIMKVSGMDQASIAKAQASFPSGQ
jgi:hypothetical protein|tara:strand:- start:4426 stop:4914 length:489 start_codon:yes stop_codon:yes gene_type:complete